MSGHCVQDHFAPNGICFGCGTANLEGLLLKSYEDTNEDTASPDGLVAEWQPSPHHQAFPGVLAGGIIGTLLDCHSNWTASIHLMHKREVKRPPVCVTADYAVSLKRPAPIDAPVKLRSYVVESTRSKVIVEATLEAGGEICASCRGTFIAVKEGHPAFEQW